jgi:hypothetical protein
MPNYLWNGRAASHREYNTSWHYFSLPRHNNKTILVDILFLLGLGLNPGTFNLSQFSFTPSHFTAGVGIAPSNEQ